MASQEPPNLDSLARAAREVVAGVSDDPEGRYQLRVRFYDKYGHTLLPDEEGVGNSELAFLRWEIDRGVLNPLADPAQPGSPWWRAVNADFLYFSELAAMLYDAGLADQPVPKAVAYWLSYIQKPRAKSWYRAHNKSIVDGYLAQVERAEEETTGEQIFMNEVLYRLLYAQAMVEDVEFGDLGAVLANPRLPSVDIIVHLPDFYPDDYPLTRQDIRHVMHKGYSPEEISVRILDERMILPQLTQLYSEAAGWIETPALNALVQNDQPVYPQIVLPPGTV